MRAIIILAIVAALGVGLVYTLNWGGENKNKSPDNSWPDLNTIANSTQDKKTNTPSMIIQQGKTYTAKLKTTAGEIDIELNSKDTPITANNFVSLAKNNFYNGTIFHRVIKGFMIQGGDPKGDGTGGPGYSFADEPIKGEYTRGTVAMANSGPDTNGSQFFIMQKDNALQKNYVIFGHVIKGMDTVDKIANAAVETNSSGEDSQPVKPVTVESVTIEEK